MDTPERHRPLLARIAERALRERGFEPEFGPRVRAEVDRLDGPAPAPAGVPDLRRLPWCSIDNDDSRDLDQLSVGEDLGAGRARLRVAVADVAAIVGRGSATDGHAGTNTTSIYTPGRIFSMLPERLSTDLTSLNADKDRLAVVIEFTVDRDGGVSDDRVYRALVHNHAKLAYPSLGAWLEGSAELPAAARAVGGLEDNLKLQDRFTRALRARRQEQGALELRTIQPRARFDGEDIVDLYEDDQDRAKELIEDLMVAANGVVARFLAGRGVPSLRRVVKTPERWPRIVALAREYGEELPGEPDAAALERFLKRRRALDPVRFPDLSLGVVKLLGNGEYVVEAPGDRPTGHFGLAVRDYTHSTAPNRRYPDLLTQRLVLAALAGDRAPYDQAELGELARHSTERENAAEKVERQLRKSAAALLLASRIGERFDGVVTGASAKGTWVRVFRPPVEGRVERGQHGLDVGDRVKVKLVHTDVERGFIDFHRVD